MEARKCVGPDLFSRKNSDVGIRGRQLILEDFEEETIFAGWHCALGCVPSHGREKRYKRLGIGPLTEGNAGGSGLWLQGKRSRNEFLISPDSIPEHLASAF